jgi:hypothetical protein
MESFLWDIQNYRESGQQDSPGHIAVPGEAKYEKEDGEWQMTAHLLASNHHLLTLR